MSPAINSYAFCADYTTMASCLFAIQTSESSGAIASNPGAIDLLNVFEKDVLQKLFNRSLQLIGKLNGTSIDTPEILVGDFIFDDFLSPDFNTGYLDTTNTGYSSKFQTILNLLNEFQLRIGELSGSEIIALDAVLIPVLEAYDEIKAYLDLFGLDPCSASTTVFQNNSAGVYLQAAGADGSDGVPAGLHLRWSLTGELGFNHLPKGNYDNATGNTTGYNRSDDYVRLVRTPYLNPVRTVIDFSSIIPSINYSLFRWTYVVNQQVNGQLITNWLTLTFSDTLQYNQLAAGLDPATNTAAFLTQYGGQLQINIKYKSAYLAGFSLANPTATSNSIWKIQAVCNADPADTTSETVNVRKTVFVGAGGTANELIYAENISQVLLLKPAGNVLQNYSFETYHDFLATRNTADWTTVGNGFSLSLADQQVYDQLESAAYPIDHLWPQYLNNTTVRAANYRDKWITSRTNEPSIKDIVSAYLSLSESDPRAIATLANDNPADNSPGLQISYLDVLNIMASDYHVARMLGLGFIDTPASAAPGDQYIYKLSYTNRESLADPTIVTNIYTTLPVSKTTSLLPEKPVLRPLTYSVPANDPAINTVFDAQGYTRLKNIRVVNVGRQPFKDEASGYDFFTDQTTAGDENIFINTRPILYGISYRPDNQSAYQLPEITQQNTFGINFTAYNAYNPNFPVDGVPETVPVPDDPTSLYMHFETQPGIHHYAVYGINWFARASVYSDEVATDTTVFPISNTLTPPTDLTVQFIQKEETLLFTSQQEQDWLSGRMAAFPGQDTNFTRVTFNWLDMADVTGLPDTTTQSLATVLKPTQVNGYFYPNLPLEVVGIIADTIPVSGSDTQLILITDGYLMMDGTPVTPGIEPSNFFRFTNSILSTTTGQFQVVNITAGTTGPLIIIEKITDALNVEDLELPGNYSVQKFYVSPDIGSRFSMVENLSQQANWLPLVEKITVVSFVDPAATPIIETETDSEGNETKFWVGGLTGNAIVAPLFSDPAGPNDLPGYYLITFDSSLNLPAHPQTNLPYDPANPQANSPATLQGAYVQWYKGWVRMPVADGETDKKLLEVVRIDQTGPITLFVYDPGYLDNSIAVSTSPTTPLSNINFHPGYRAYLYPEPGHDFNGAGLLPSPGNSSRKTLFGVQAADSMIGGTGFTSKVSSPAVILARTIAEPADLPLPVSANLVIRPDQTGRAAFTFDGLIPAGSSPAVKPFGFAFYRTSNEDVLYALYDPDTVVNILAALAALTSDPDHNLRYLNLVNLNYDPAHPGLFEVFNAVPQAYGFPVPDKAGLTLAGDTTDMKTAKYKAAILKTLLPLTAQTPVYAYIKQGANTSSMQNKVPVIRDADGNMLDTSSPLFDPFPMVLTYSDPQNTANQYIRFTDYTLYASSRFQYFYAWVAVSNQLAPGNLSPFIGPVTILQLLPPEPPLVRSFYVGVPSVSTTSAVAVTFQLSPFSAGDYVSLIRIYRAFDSASAASLLTMTAGPDIAVNGSDPMGMEVDDLFTDLSVLPWGQLIYYRLVAIRLITNEKGEQEEVLSEESELEIVNLVDTNNPLAPDITYTTTAPGEIMLHWSPVTYKGTYYLYQLNASGNWARIYSVPPPGSSGAMSFPTTITTQDNSGNRLYNTFKVTVQNSAGLFNLTDNPITI